MSNMISREQLRNIARSCSRYDVVEDSSLRSESAMSGVNEMTCESCEHFTKEHKCNLNLIDEILSNMAEVQYE